MQGVPQDIVERQLALFDEVDAAYRAGVRAALTTYGEGRGSLGAHSEEVRGRLAPHSKCISGWNKLIRPRRKRPN
jgi:hypothetical protein